MQHFRAAPGQNSAVNLDFVIQLRMVEHLHCRPDSASLRIVCPVNQALNARMHHGSGTHRTRLNCNKQLAIAQAMVTNVHSGFAQSNNLRVRRRIVIDYVAVPSSSDYLSPAQQDRANRDFAKLQCALRATKSFLHPQFVCGRFSAIGFLPVSLFRHSTILSVLKNLFAIADAALGEHEIKICVVF